MLGFYTVEQFFSTLSSVEFAKMRNSCGFFARLCVGISVGREKILYIYCRESCKNDGGCKNYCGMI